MTEILSNFSAVVRARTIYHMELPADLFLSPVPEDTNLVSFSYDFDVKAVADEPVVEELEDGDIMISGMAAVFEGVDRDGENFAPGAFQRGIKAFIEGQSPLCFHHKRDHVLGKVLELEEVEGKGLRMKARVDGAIKNHPTLGTIYEQIKRGTINALSIGGYFRRGITADGPRITDVDFVEVSATAAPVHPGTHFSVIAGKALASDLKVPDNVSKPDLPVDEIREEDFFQIQYALESLSRVIDRLEKRGDGGEEPDTSSVDVAV